MKNKKEIFDKMVSKMSFEEKICLEDPKTNLKKIIEQDFATNSFEFTEVKFFSYFKYNVFCANVFIIFINEERITIKEYSLSKNNKNYALDLIIRGKPAKEKEFILKIPPVLKCLRNIDFYKKHLKNLQFICDNENNLPAIEIYGLTIDTRKDYIFHFFKDGEIENNKICSKMLFNKTFYLKIKHNDQILEYNYKIENEKLFLFFYSVSSSKDLNIIDYEKYDFIYNKTMFRYKHNVSFVEYNLLKDKFSIKNGSYNENMYLNSEIINYQFDLSGKYLKKYTTRYLNGRITNSKEYSKYMITKQTKNNLDEVTESIVLSL